MRLLLSVLVAIAVLLQAEAVGSQQCTSRLVLRDPGAMLLGGSAAAIGDINGDGFDDVVVGAPASNCGEPGRAVIFSGSDGVKAGVVNGDDNGDYFGWVVSGIGDANGDGVGDFVVGAPHFFDTVVTPSPGEAVLYSGMTGTVLHVFHGERIGSAFGSSVCRLGDVNGDGRADFAIGAPYFNDSPYPDSMSFARGSAYVYSGASYGLMRDFFGGENGDHFGSYLSGGCDVDSDGVGDLVVGAPGNDAGGSDAGRVYVYSGGNWNLLHAFTGLTASEGLGVSVSCAGDIDRDGYGDVVAGAPQAGLVRVFSGVTGETLRTVHTEIPGAWFGGNVCGAGDINNDGYADFVASMYVPWNRTDGAAYVYSGRSGVLLHQLMGGVADTNFGNFVSGGDDIDGNGLPDIIVGAIGAIDSCVEGRGCAYVFSCSPPPVVLVHGWRPARHMQTDRSIAVWDSVKPWLQDAGFPYVWVLNTPYAADCGYPGDRGAFAESAESLSVFITRMKDSVGLPNSTKVNIIAHSLGGVVARRYVSEPTRAWKANGTVGKLIMLGTPNAGLELATWARFLKIQELGQAADQLTCPGHGPAARGLAEKEMENFNAWFRDRHKAEYAMVAGHCSQEYRCWYRLFNLIPVPSPVRGAHDGFIPVASVFGIGSDGDSCQACGYSHSDLGDTSQVTKKLTHEVLIPWLRGEDHQGSMCGTGDIECVPPIGAGLFAAGPDTSTSNLLHASLGLCNDVDWTEIGVLMEGGTQGAVAVCALAGDVEVVLEDPLGLTIDSIAAALDSSHCSYSNDLGVVTYGLFDPVPGLWQVSVRATTMFDTIAPFIVLAGVGNDVNITAVVDSSALWLGGEVAFQVTVTEGAISVPGCSIAVSPVFEDATAFPDFPLFDDGLHDDGAVDDGNYGGRFADAGQAGVYSFKITAAGSTATTGAFERVAVLETWVVSCGCECHADPECDGVRSDILDVVSTINVAFRGFGVTPDPNPYCPVDATDADCSGATDILDVVKVIDVAFRGAEPMSKYCDPCAP